MARGYRESRKELTACAARADKLPLALAARESFLLGDAAIRQLVFDPVLPGPLVKVAERRAFVEAVKQFDRDGHTIWRTFLKGD